MYAELKRCYNSNMFSKLASFFKPQNQSRVEPILVIEIESGSVAAALVLINRTNNVCPTVKYYHRHNFAYNPRDGENSRDFFNLLFGSVEKTISVLFKQIKKEERPVAIHCFSGSPIYFSQTQHLSLVEDEPFRVTPDLIKQIIDNQLAAVVEKFPTTHPAFGNDYAEVVESKLIKIYLNGYEVANPYKLKTKKMELVHFSSLVSGRITKRVESVLAGFYPDLPVSWHSIAFALFNSININPKSLPNFILVSTGGLNTEIIVIKDRLINEIVSIPFGEESIIQILEHKLKRPAAEIRSLFSLQLMAGMNANSKTYLTPYIDQLKEEWDRHFTEGISALTDTAFLPRNLLVVGHGALCDIMAKWIKTEDFSKTTRSQSAIRSASLSSNYFGNKCIYEGDQAAAEDIHLMAEIIFCDTLIKQGQRL